MSPITKTSKDQFLGLNFSYSKTTLVRPLVQLIPSWLVLAEIKMCYACYSVRTSLEKFGRASNLALRAYCPYICTVISSVGADGQSGGFDSSNYTLNPISSSAKGRVRLDDLLTWMDLFLGF